MIDPTDAWKPFEATADDPWDLRKVAHLHRRAGFCANWGQLQRDLKSGPATSIDRLLEPPDDDVSFQQVSDGMLHAAGGSGESDTFSSSGASRRGAEWWLYRMAYGGDPLGEKLTLFWHNHFATALRGVYNMPLMLRQNATLRKHARGNFGELLSAIEADPAMLLWLDGGRNQKNHPNENFARELLELFTLGTGNYTENDVREAARGLTGWQAGRNNLLQRTNDFSYREDLADVAPKTFLGRTGSWRTSDILQIILDHPAAAEHLCRRLYRWFIDETSEPNDELIRPLAAEYRASNYSAQHVVGIILRSRLFYSPAIYRRRVKSPVEFCVGVIRQLEPVRSPNLLRFASHVLRRRTYNRWHGREKTKGELTGAFKNVYTYDNLNRMKTVSQQSAAGSGAHVVAPKAIEFAYDLAGQIDWIKRYRTVNTVGGTDEHFYVVCRYVERNALRAGLVKRAEDWRWGSLWRWLQKTEPDPRLLSAWPLSRLPNWVERVNEPLTKQELDAVRLSAQRGRPLGDKGWVEAIARRLNLESTMRPRGRQRVRPLPETANKEA